MEPLVDLVKYCRQSLGTEFKALETSDKLVVDEQITVKSSTFRGQTVAKL